MYFFIDFRKSLLIRIFKVRGLFNILLYSKTQIYVHMKWQNSKIVEKTKWVHHFYLITLWIILQNLWTFYLNYLIMLTFMKYRVVDWYFYFINNKKCKISSTTKDLKKFQIGPLLNKINKHQHFLIKVSKIRENLYQVLFIQVNSQYYY